MTRTAVSPVEALEETLFLGLRLNGGVNLQEVSAAFGEEAIDEVRPAIAQLIAEGLLQQLGERIHLTARGRLLSNEVFQRFIATADLARKM